MITEENPLVLSTIRSATVHHYPDIQAILRDIAILSGSFKFSKREMPQIYTTYNRILTRLATVPVSSLSLEQWELLVESLCKDEPLDQSVYELPEEEKKQLDGIERHEDGDNERRRDLKRKNRLHLMEKGIISKLLNYCFDQDLVAASARFLAGDGDLPEANEDFMNRCKAVMTIVVQDWKDIPFDLTVTQNIVQVSLAYMKRYIRVKDEIYNYAVGIHGTAIEYYFSGRELPSETDDFTNLLVKGYMDSLKDGATEDTDRYLHMVDFFLEILPWLPARLDGGLDFENQLWDSINTILTMVEEEVAGRLADSDGTESDSNAVDGSDVDGWLETLFSTVPVDLDRKHASEMSKNARILKLKVHLCLLLGNLTSRSAEIESRKIKHSLRRLCDLSSTDFGCCNEDVRASFEKAVRLGAISPAVQKEIIKECLLKGMPQAQLAVKTIVAVAPEAVRNELAEMVFQFFIQRLKTKHSDGEKHSFSLDDLLLCRSARLTMVSSPKPISLFSDLLAYFNSLCSLKRLTVDPLTDEIMSLLHIVFTGGNFLEYFKLCMSLPLAEIIAEPPGVEKLTTIEEMGCDGVELSKGFRNFAQWSLTQPGELCPPYVFPVFTEKELEEKDDLVVLSHMFRLLPYYRSGQGREMFQKLYSQDMRVKIERFFGPDNVEVLFARILTLFTEDISSRTKKFTALDSHLILSFYDCLLVAISWAGISQTTIQLLRSTLKYLDIYELNLSCARWNFRTGIDRLHALLKIYRNKVLNECMQFQRMVDDCVHSQILDMMHHEKKKTISPAYPTNSFKLSFEKLDCVLSSDEPTVIEGIIECIRSELCTYLFHQFDKQRNNSHDGMVEFFIDVASSAQYAIEDAETANTYLNIIMKDNCARQHHFLTDILLSVATSSAAPESFEYYPLDRLFGDVIGELFCSEIYANQWVQMPPMGPLLSWLEACAGTPGRTLNPCLVASFGNIFEDHNVVDSDGRFVSRMPHDTIKESLAETISSKIHLLPLWIKNSQFPAITLAQFTDVLEHLKVDNLSQLVTECVEVIIRETVTEELSQFVPIEVQSTDRFAQSWLCSRPQKEPRVYAHYKLENAKRTRRQYFEDAVKLLCRYGDAATHIQLTKAASSVIGNWCGLNGTEEKVVRGETVLLQDNTKLLFRISVSNTLLHYVTELFTTLGGDCYDGYFSDLEAVKELVTRRGCQSLPISSRLDAVRSHGNVSNLCSFSTTDAKYKNQPWYNCYTCNFVGQMGCCSVCAVNCHRGHDIAFSKNGSFFCDCGAKKCAAMKTVAHALNGHNAARGRRIAVSMPTKCEDPEEEFLFSFPDDLSDQKDLFKPILADLRLQLTENATGIENAVRASVDAHINTYDIESKRKHVLDSLSSVEQIKLVTDQPVMDVLENEMNSSSRLTYMVPQMGSREQALDSQKPKDVCGRIELENGRQLWIMLEGNQFTVHHIAQGDNIVDELSYARQETEHLTFTAKRMSCCEDKCAILGRNEALLLRFGGDGEIRDKTSLSIGEIAAHGNNPFTKAVWAPRRAGIIAMATAQYVRVFDIAIDTNNHLEELVLPVGNIQDIALIDDQSSLVLLVLSTAGHLYRHVVQAQIPQNNSFFLTNTITVPPPQTGAPVSFHYSPCSRLLFLSFENTSWFGVVPNGNLRVEQNIEWRKIPCENSLTSWQESSGIVAAMSHQGGNSGMTYFYPTTRQLLLHKYIESRHKKAPYAHLIYTSPSNTTVNAVQFHYDLPYVIPMVSHWASLPDLWIDGLPLEFTTTVEMVKEDTAEDLALEDCVTMIEGCELLEKVEAISEDLNRFYDSQDLSSRLANVGNCPVTVLQSNSFQVTLTSPEFVTVVPRCIRIEVPEVKGPTRVSLLDRTVSLSTATPRFFDILLTRAESLRLEDEPLDLEFTGRDNFVVITSIKIYGIKKRDFGFPTPQLSSKAPLSLPEEHLKHLLRLLHVMAENKEFVGNISWLTKITEQLVSIRSTNREVYSAANSLLRVLFEEKDRTDYYDIKDSILYSDLIHLTASPHPLPVIIVDRLVSQIKMVLSTRCDRFLQRLATIENGADKLLVQIRSQLRLHSVEESLSLVEMFCLLSFIFMSSIKGHEREKIYQTFLDIFVDEKAVQYASVVRIVGVTLINTFAVSTHGDRKILANFPDGDKPRMLRQGGMLPYYSKSTIQTPLDDIPKDEKMMGPLVEYEELAATGMYDFEAKHLVELLRKILHKIRDEVVIIVDPHGLIEPVPTFQLVLFAYNMLHNLSPDKILPIIVELIEMVNWQKPSLEQTESVCRQLLLFRLVVYFLSKCTEYTEKRMKKKRENSKEKSRENSTEPTTADENAKATKGVFDKFEEGGKRESYEKLLQGISKKLLEVQSLPYCLKMLQLSLPEWNSTAPEPTKPTTRAWGRSSSDSLLDGIKTEENQREAFYSTIMQLVIRLPFQLRKINSKLEFGEEWTNVICEIISNPYPSGIRSFSKKLLLLSVGGDRTQYKSIRDLYLMRNHMRQLHEKFKEQMSHKELTEVVDIIAALGTTATQRPAMWRNICEEHLTWMLEMVVRVADAVTTNVLELLVAAIRVETAVEENQHIANKLIAVKENREALKKLLLRFLVGRDDNRRWLAHGLVRSTIQLAFRSNQMILVRIMWYELWPEARERGSNGAQLADLLATYLPRVFNTNELMNVCDIEMQAVKQISERIVHEGHDRTYEMMTGLGLGWNFMLMVSNPCLNCFSKKRSSETMKLSSIKQDMRFSSNAQMIKLIGFYEVNRVIIKMSDVKRAKTVKKISIFYCPKPVDSPVELKTKPELWQLAGSTTISSPDNEMIVSLSVPVVTSTLIVQFTDVVETRQSHELQCPRCSSIVPPNPGVCENCGENAYQCFKCRSINYDDKDPFLCQHCGFCKYARIDVSVVCRSLPRVQPIVTDADRTAAVEHMSQLLVDVEQSRSQMLIGRAMCESLWLRTRPLPAHSARAEGIHIAEMAVAGMPIIPVNEHGVYCIKEVINYCTLAHDELCSQTQQLLAYRDELLQYDGSSTTLSLLTNGFYNTSSSCFGCLCTGIRHSIAILQGACDDPYAVHKILGSQDSYLEVVKLGRTYCPLTADVEQFMCRLAFENEGGSELLCGLVERDWLPGSVLCKSLTLYPDSFWEMKLRSLLQTAVEKNDEDTVISTLQVIEQLLTDSGSVRRRAYRKLQYGENDPNEDVPQRRVKIVNRAMDNRPNLARWMNRKGKWEESNKTTEALVDEEKKILEGIDEWLWQCLFSQWALVRSTAAKVLHSLAKQPGYLGSSIRIIIRGMSMAREKSPQVTEQFFNAVYNILNKRKHLKMRLYLHGLHIHLLNHIHEECRRLYKSENMGANIDHGNGILLRNYIEVLVSLFCGDSSEGFLLKAAVPHIMKPLLQSTIFLKRLLLHRTRSIDICRNALELLLRKVSSKEPLMLMQTAVRALDDDVDQFTQAQIFSVIMEVLAPERHKDEGFLIQIEKDPVQEDFLQGRMTGNPYRSNDLGMGPLMRDIKNKICRDTEMITLLEDDNGMELLVNNQIISLSLPVARVYEKLWHRDHPGQPLTIVYRMRGLMGDAVEQFIETLGTTEEQSAEDTSLSSLVEQFSACGGITKTLATIENCDITTGGRILLGSVLSLLERVSKSEKGRVGLVRAGGVRIFTKILRQCVESSDDSMLAIGKDFLKLLDCLVKDMSTHEHLHDLTADDARWLVQLALRKTNKEKQLAEDVTKLLGNLVLGNEQSEEVLVNCCKETLRWCVIDTTTDVAKRKEIVEDAEILCEIVTGILPSSGGNKLKTKIVSSEVLSEACAYLLNSHPPLYSATESQEWKSFLMKPSLRLMLTFMYSMAKRHVPSQNALSEQSLPLLHRLEQVASDNSIGTLAENVMEALKENEQVAKKIEAVRLETKQKKRQMAMAMRNKQLSKMGMQIGKQGEVKIASRKIANEPHLEEITDPLTACCICREPILTGDKAAGVYAYATVSTVLEQINCLSTVSQMVLVHIDCHMTAVRRSGGGRNADEWSKAMLHNAGAKCNVLTPLALHEGPFQQALARFQSDMDVITSTPAVTRGTVFLDMCLLMDRFVNFTSFSDLSHGGGRESNVQYLGVLHLLACSLSASDELRTLLPQWCVYSFLMTEESLEQWNSQRVEVLDVALKNCPQDRLGWSNIKSTCLSWSFVDLYFREVIPISGDRLSFLREHFLETMKKSAIFIQRFDSLAADCVDFASFAFALDLAAADFAEALELHQAQ